MHGLKRLQFNSNEIIEARNESAKALDAVISKLNNTIEENQRNSKETLLFVYYAGHGQLR